MKKIIAALSAVLSVMLIFSSCSSLFDFSVKANPEIKRIFDSAFTPQYVLSDIKPIDLYQKMDLDDSMTKKTVSDKESNTSVTYYYSDNKVIYADYDGYGEDCFDFYTKSKNGNDIIAKYQDQDGKRYAVTITGKNNKGTYTVDFENGLDRKMPYGAQSFSITVSPKVDNTFATEATYDITTNDEKTTCRLTSAKYFDGNENYKQYVCDVVDDTGKTEETNKIIYEKFDDEINIDDELELPYKTNEINNLHNIEVLMGEHRFAFLKNDQSDGKTETQWYFHSKIAFTFDNKKSAEEFAKQYNEDVNKSDIKKHIYYVEMGSCDLKIAKNCTFGKSKNFGEFSQEEWNDSQYYTIKINNKGEITSFSTKGTAISYY